MSCISSGEDDGTNLGIEQKSLSCYGIARLPATIIMMHVNTLQVHYWATSLNYQYWGMQMVLDWLTLHPC